MADATQQDLHHQILELLFDKVRDDPYPSVTMLDMIEQSLSPDDVSEYTEILMEKVSSDQFPSLDHLRRLQQFA
jgi:hypothetical protein